MNDYRERFRAMARSTDEPRKWFSIENKKGANARIEIYDFIDPWGGEWGVSAKEFVKELNAIDAKAIDLHINSGGGDVQDAITIYNGLISHPATINVHIDGLAASAASFIAQAGDTVTMGAYTELMIHDASCFAWGNASDMQRAADFLDRMSNKIAAMYADRAGGDVAEWRAAMQAETWYSAEEAVEAGLADNAVKPKKKDEDEKAKDVVSDRPEAAAYKYRGRAEAPAPRLFNKRTHQRSFTQSEILNSFLTDSNNVDSNATEVSTVTPEQLDALGLTDGASDLDVLNAILALKNSDAPAEENKPEEEATPEKTEESQTTKTVETTEEKKTEAPAEAQNSLRLPEGMQAVDAASLTALQAEVAALRADNAAAKKREHDASRAKTVQNAIDGGKVAPAARVTYEAMYDLDPAKATQILNELPAVFPVAEIGHAAQAQDAIEDSDAYPTMHLTEAERAGIEARKAG